MTHDEILKAARERIATITAEVVKLEAEKLKLRVLVGDFPQSAQAPSPPLMPQPFQPWPPGDWWSGPYITTHDPSAFAVVGSGTVYTFIKP